MVGITAVGGAFEANQPVKLLDPDGVELGRGLCSMDSSSLLEALQQSRANSGSPVVVHRDLLVLSD